MIPAKICQLGGGSGSSKCVSQREFGDGRDVLTVAPTSNLASGLHAESALPL